MTTSSFLQASPVKNKFSTKKYFPDQELRELFLSLFHPYQYIFKPASEKGTWMSANESWQLRPSEIFKAIAGQHHFYLGTRPGKFTRFAVLDIDKRSIYHNKKSLQLILKVLAEAGLEQTNLYQSSQSGGWHLYVFFEEPVPTKELRSALVRLLLAKGFKIDRGQLEVFPNPGNDNSQGYGLRLPLQPGFAWLNSSTLDVEQERDELSPAEALHAFILNLWDGNSYHDYRSLIDYTSSLEMRHTERMNALKNSASPAKDSGQNGNSRMTSIVPMRTNNEQPASSQEDVAIVIDIFGFVPPGMNASNWVAGRNYAVTGLTGPSQRHQAGFCLSHYAFYGDPSRGIAALGYNYGEERFLFVWEILSTKHNGWSKELERQSPEAVANVRRQADWVPQSKRLEVAEKNQSETKQFDPKLALRNVRANAKRARGAREKISAAVNSLLDEGIQITLKSIHEASGVAVSTIRRHPDLWKDKQEEQYEDIFAAVSGECNAVVEGGDSKNPPLPTTPVEKEPSGLLAARRIVYELKMREERRQRERAKERQSFLETVAGDWKERVLKHLPESIQTAETTYLQFVIAVCGIQRATSPDWESQQWIEGIIKEVNDELKARWTPPEAVRSKIPLPIQQILDTG